MLKTLVRGTAFLVIGQLISLCCPAQQDPKIDSLLQVLTVQREDTGRVSTLNNLSKQFLRNNKITDARKHAQEALVLARKTSFKKGEAAAHRNMGMIYTREYNSPEARKCFIQLLKVSEEMGDKFEMAVANNNIANSYFNETNYGEALVYHFASLRLKKEIGDKPGIVMSYNNIGLVNWNKGNYPEAYKNYFAALKVREEIKDLKGVAHSYNVLGVVYDDEGNYPEALKNYLSSLKLYEKLGLKFGIAACYNNIGELYRKQGSHVEALRNFRDCIRVAKEIDDQGQVGMAYNNMAGVYKDMGLYEEARKNCEASFKISEEIDDKQGMASAYGNLGTLLYEEGKLKTDPVQRAQYFNKALDHAFKGLDLFKVISFPDGVTESYTLIGSVHTDLRNFTEARKFLTEGLSLSKERGVKEMIKNNYQALARLDSMTGNWEGAYINHASYILLRDSSVNQENSGKILRMQVQYEYSKKEDSLKYQQILSTANLRQQTLLNQQQLQVLILQEKDLALINKEKKLQDLQMQKDSAEFAAHKVEADKQQGQLEILNKEKTIQSLELNKQKQLKKYLLAGLALLLILGFVVYRNYRNRQQLKLLAIRNKIASDLHDDIGSTLSSISIFSQMAQQQSSEVAPFLESIGENSRKMLDAMADIVWTINPENDQFEKIVLRMRSFAFELLGAKKIDFEFSASEEVARLKLPMEVRKNLYLIFKEATNNMVKYSGANKALFSIKEDKNNLTMLIHDNGKGFDTRQPTIGNGLKNMKKRAEEMGARFAINSAPGDGTTIELRVAV